MIQPIDAESEPVGTSPAHPFPMQHLLQAAVASREFQILPKVNG